MKEWKIRQEIYNKLHTEFEDDIKGKPIVEEFEESSVISRALRYFTVEDENWYYPGKSYSVAIIYALLLEKHFNEEFYSALNDPDLLYGLDPYFKTYQESKNIYDEIISKIPLGLLENVENHSWNMKKTIEYFEKEFLLHEETKIFAPF